MAQRSEKASDVSKRIRAKAEKAKATQIETIEELAKQGGKRLYQFPNLGSWWPTSHHGTD
jgi:hypothetical protein